MSACHIGVSTAPLDELAERIARVDWLEVEADLDAQGAAVIERLLTPVECIHLSSLYGHDESFRSRVVMARHGFGRGEYRYFAYPLPGLIGALRESLYVRLAPIANRWYDAMKMPVGFPERHADLIARCHASGQRKPTPLLLQYGAGDYNCLHQDVYGEHVFPLQAVVLLSEPGRDFEGGQFVMTEQRPRMQSRALVLSLRQGDVAVIAVRHRPVHGARGVYRANLKHGVSRLLSGVRHTAGIIFHDAA